MIKENNSKKEDIFKGVTKENLDDMFKASVIQEFASKFIKEDASPKTKPSIVALGGSKEIKLDRLPPEDIEKFLWMHPVVPRGIEIKANRMIRRGYTINPSLALGLKEPSDKSKQAAKEMEELLQNSGGVTRIKKWIEDAFGYGGGYMTLVPNKEGEKIVRVNPEHPVFFRIAKDPKKRKNVDYTTKGDLVEAYEGEMKIDDATKLPSAFTQVVFSRDKKKFVPFGEELDASQVAHLVFDTWGDEVEGISLVQYLHLTIKYLLNIEEAGAETLHKSGFTQKKITTEIMTEKDLRKIAKNLKEINAKDAIILPKGSNVENLYPGTSQFKEFHEVFLQLIAIRLGIPKPLLTMDGTSTNKACYSEDTRTLTNNGFKYYWEIGIDDSIAQYSLDNNEIKFVKHNGLYQYDYDGKMHQYKNKRLDMLVTPDHRMLTKEFRQKDYGVIRSEDISYNRISFLNSAFYKGKRIEDFDLEKGVTIPMDLWLEFLGYYLSEGGFSKGPLKPNGKKSYLITFAQKENEKVGKMRNCFQKLSKILGFKLTEYENKGYVHWGICNKKLWNYLLNNCGTDSDNKHFPKRTLELHKNQLEILYDALMLGDGCSKGKSYYSTSNQLITDFQALAMLIGKSTKKSLLYKSYGNRVDCFRVSLSDLIEPKFEMKDLEEINYVGKVYCFNTDSGFFITERNGLVTIQGNTLDEQVKDMFADFKADEIKVKQVIEDQIFVPACKLLFGDDFDEIPNFDFNPVKEEKKEKIENLNLLSQTILRLSNSASRLKDSGYEEASNKIIEFLQKECFLGEKRI